MADESEAQLPPVLVTDVFDDTSQEGVDHIVNSVLDRQPAIAEALTKLPISTPVLLIIPTRVAPVEPAQTGWAKDIPGSRMNMFAMRASLSQTDAAHLMLGDRVTPDLWIRRINQARQEQRMAEVQVSGLRNKLKFLTGRNEAMAKALLAHGLKIGEGDKVTVRAGTRKLKI